MYYLAVRVSRINGEIFLARDGGALMLVFDVETWIFIFAWDLYYLGLHFN